MNDGKLYQLNLELYHKALRQVNKAFKNKDYESMDRYSDLVSKAGDSVCRIGQKIGADETELRKIRRFVGLTTLVYALQD